MTTAIEKLGEFKAKLVEALQKEILSESKALFKEASDHIFSNHPVLVSFSWVGYTPHWNDGDMCEFSAHTEDIYLKTTDHVSEEPSEEEDEDGGEFSKYNYQEGPYGSKKDKAVLTPREAAGKDVIEFLENFDDDTLKEMFGDHVKVIVTKSGVEERVWA